MPGHWNTVIVMLAQEVTLPSGNPIAVTTGISVLRRAFVVLLLFGHRRDDDLVHRRCRLRLDITVKIDGKVTHSGSQKISWLPAISQPDPACASWINRFFGAEYVYQHP